MENVDSELSEDSNQANKNEGEAKQLSRPFHVLSPPGAVGAEIHSYSTTRRQIISATMQHHGPLPTAEYLREINEIIPNGAERIMAMAENHASHSQRMEQMETEALIALDKGELTRSNSGLLAGFIVAMSFGFASVYLITAGHDIPGTVFGTVDIVALASVFVIGRVYSNRKENDKTAHEEFGENSQGEGEDTKTGI